MDTLIKKLTLPIFMLGLIMLIIRGDFLSRSPLVIAGQLAGFILIICSRVAFGKQQFNFTAEPGDGPLAQRGPYRILRHPIYAGALLIIWSSILGHWSIFNVAIGVIVLLFVLLRISAEERLLRKQYLDYADYALRTKRILPFIY